MLLRCRVFNHQLAELCAERYHILPELDGTTAAQLQDRLLSPGDTFASKARRTLHAETVTLRNHALNKSLVAGQVRQTQQGGQKRGGSRCHHKKGGEPPAKLKAQGGPIPGGVTRPFRCLS